MGAAAIFVDVGIVSVVDVNGLYSGAKLCEYGFVDDASSTIGAVHTYMESAEVC